MMGAEVKALVEKTVMMEKHSYLNVVEEGTKGTKGLMKQIACKII